MFYFEHKTVSLSQCNNQKNYSVFYNIEGKEVEMQLIFFIYILKMVRHKWDRSDKVKFFGLFWTTDEGIENN